MKTTVGERVVEIMHRHNLNQTQLAQKLGVSPEAVRRWKENMGMSRKNQERVLTVFPDVDRDWLLFGDDKNIVSEQEVEYKRLNDLIHEYQSKLDQAKEMLNEKDDKIDRLNREIGRITADRCDDLGKVKSA